VNVFATLSQVKIEAEREPEVSFKLFGDFETVPTTKPFGEGVVGTEIDNPKG
jgi:hypothetical protein